MASKKRKILKKKTDDKVVVNLNDEYNNRRIKSLPDQAKRVLSIVEKVSTKDEYDDFVKDVVLLAQGASGKDLPSSAAAATPNTKEKTTYGNSLSLLGDRIFNEIGTYNPDSIPIDIYDRMSRDPTIALGLAAIRSTPNGISYRINCKNKVQKNMIYKQIKKVFRKTNFQLTSAIKYGFAASELIWELGSLIIEDDENSDKVIYDGSAWILKNIKFIHPKTVRFKIDRNGNLEGMIQEDLDGARITQLDLNEMAIYSHDYEFGMWYGNARLKNIYPDWYWCLVLIHFMLKYYERKGTPLTVANGPLGTRTDSDGNKVNGVDYALKIGQLAASNTVVALPTEFDKNSPGHNLWGLKYLEDQQRGEMFIHSINFFESRKLRGIFVPDRLGLASDGSPHSSSGSSAGDTLDIFMMMIQSLISDIEDFYNEQIIPKIQMYNFDPKEIREATIVMEKLDHNTRLLYKDVLLRMIMLSGGFIRDGISPKMLPSISKLAETLGIPFDDFKDIIDMATIPKQGSSNTNPSGAGNSQKDLAPSVKKKENQDDNNSNRATPRKTRDSRERSSREKRS